MSSIEIPAVDKLSIHIQGNDVIVRGEEGRTSLALRAPRVADLAALLPETDTDTLHLELPGPLTILAPTTLSLHLQGEIDDVVLRHIDAATLSGCQGDLVASQMRTLEVTEPIKGDVALRNIELSAHVNAVGSDLAAAHIEVLKVGPIQGDTSISDATDVSLESVGGDLALTHATDIQIGSVHGDVSLNNYQGSATIRAIAGDCATVSPGKTLVLTQVAGDATLRGALQPGGKYWITAGGDVAVRVSGDARVAIRAGGEIIAGEELVREEQTDGSVVVQLGTGEPRADLNIDAGGDVILNSPTRWYRHHSALVDAELRKAMNEVRNELKKAAVTVKMELGRVGREVVKGLKEEPLPEDTSVSVRGIVRDLLDSLEPKTPAPPSPPPAKRTIDRDELKSVLEMLEKGIITVEEAAQLIEALKR